MKLSVCLATYNEENNLAGCLDSVRDIANEIVIVDGSSSDRTVEIAKSYGAKVIMADNPPVFHINKQKAMDAATGDWILQLDADERVTPELKKEILAVMEMGNEELEEYQKNLKDRKLFLRYQKIIEDGQRKTSNQEPATGNSYVAFYMPRLNYFLGRYLRYGGVYPDGVNRLLMKGMAYLPCRDVHELMVVKGRAGWLQSPLLHNDSPTFSRYWMRNTRYVELMAREWKEKKYPKTIAALLDCLIVKPLGWFFSTTIRHKSFLDGWQGIAFSFFSSLRFPRAYIRYLRSGIKNG